MDIKEQTMNLAYLQRAAPETVYAWLQHPRRTWEVEKIEKMLLARGDDIINLALAQWATAEETIQQLYEKHCSRERVAAWPPVVPSLEHAILVGILGNNQWGQGFRWSDQLAEWLSETDFEELVEHADESLFHALHTNSAMGYTLHERCCNRQGVYAKIDELRWLTALISLSYNPRMLAPNRDTNESPDTSSLSDLNQRI